MTKVASCGYFSSPMEPFTLIGNIVVLEPMSLGAVDELVAVANEDRATFQFTEVPNGRAEMRAHTELLLREAAKDTVVPFVVRRLSDDRIVGCTRYLTIRSWFDRGVPDAVEIGGTWLGATAQRTPVNTEAKLLLLTNALESWEVQRVDFKTDARNERSRNAIQRLGAQFDGILRGWQPSLVEGELGRARDSAMYSIIPSEWSPIKAALQARLR